MSGGAGRTERPRAGHARGRGKVRPHPSRRQIVHFAATNHGHGGGDLTARYGSVGRAPPTGVRARCAVAGVGYHSERCEAYCLRGCVPGLRLLAGEVPERAARALSGVSLHEGWVDTQAGTPVLRALGGGRKRQVRSAGTDACTTRDARSTTARLRAVGSDSPPIGRPPRTVPFFMSLSRARW